MSFLKSPFYHNSLLQDLEQYWSFWEESDEEKEVEVEEGGIAELYLAALRDVLAVLAVES